MSTTSKGASRLSSRLFPGYFTLVLAISLVGVAMAVTRPYLSLFLTDVIHTSPVQLGTFMCVNGLGTIVLSTWLGKMSDNHRPKKDVILLASLCASVGYASFTFLHHYWILLIASTLLLGVGSASFPQLFAYAREAVIAAPRADATMTISTLRSFFSLAWVIGPLLGAVGLGLLGYNGLFISTAVLFLCVLGLTVFLLERRRTAKHQRAAVQSLLQNLKRRDVFASCVALVAASTATSINGMYMPLFVNRTLGAPEHVVGWVFSLSAGLEIPIMIWLGVIADRFGKRRLLILGTISGCVYYLGAAFARAPWEMLALQLLCAVFVAISASIGMSYFQDFMPESTGAATTLFSNTNNIGSVAGSLLGGAIAEAFGFRSVYWCSLALGVVASVFLYLARSKEYVAVQTGSDVANGVQVLEQ